MKFALRVLRCLAVLPIAFPLLVVAWALSPFGLKDCNSTIFKIESWCGLTAFWLLGISFGVQ